MINIDQIRDLLISEGNMTDVAHVITFQGYRDNSNGESQTVTVKILDEGSIGHAGYRYNCEATSAEGKNATGNGAATIEEAIAIVHWNNLD